MAVKGTTVVATRSRRYGNVTTNVSRNMQVSSELIPIKVKGQFITLPNNIRFRRATSYSRSRYWFEPKVGETSRGKSNTYGEQWVITTPGGYWTDQIFTGNWVYRIFAPYCSNTIGGPTITTSMRNEAGTKARLKIADNKANIGEDLATFRQTLELIKNPLSTLVKSLKEVHSKQHLRPFLHHGPTSPAEVYKLARDFFGGKGFDGIARQYLAYAYGWKPLMQDIHGVAELMKESAKNPLLLHAVGKSIVKDYASDLSQNDISYTTTNEVFNRVMEARVLCSIWARIDPDHTGLRTASQLGLVNPLSLAWELVPWSFVIDWALPIGSVLNALSAPAGLIFVDGSISCRLSAVADLTSLSYTLNDSGTQYRQRQAATGVVRYEGYSRETLSNWPSVGLWFDSDPFRGDRALKAVALAVLTLPSLRR